MWWLQTRALLVDAYRDLHSRKLFWITMVLSALCASLFLIVGIDERGISFFGKTIANDLINTTVVDRETFYKEFIFVGIGLDLWLAWIASILALVSVCGLFPSFMQTGVIDTTLAAPIGRWRLFLTRYVLGLLFVALQVLVFTVMAFLGMGLRAGVWAPGVFIAVPLVVVFFSYLYAICVLIGVLGRSPILALLLTIGIWFVLWVGNKADQVLITFVAQSDVRVERAERIAERVRDMDPEQRRDHIERWGHRYPGLQAVVEELEAGEGTALDDWVEAQRESTHTVRGWLNLVTAVRTVLPKTSDTIGLVRRWTIDLAELEPPEGPPADADAVPSAAADDFSEVGYRAEQLSRERSPWWVLGTSLLFEAVLVALAGWRFVRRDY